MKQRLSIGGLTLILSLIFSYLYSRGLAESWFWKYSWFDLAMHALGGIVMGLFFLFIYYSYSARTQKKVTSKGIMASLIIPACIVTIVWEIYEYVFDIFSEVNYVQDTSVDILLGIGGAFVIALIARLGITRSNESQKL